MPNDYAAAHKARKGPSITMGKGMQRVEPQDPMTGVTDPKKLLKSNTQRIDKNVNTPDQLIDAGILKGHIDPVRGA